MGFAAALSSVGVRARRWGGSAFSKALINMEVAAATGGQALEDFCPRVGHDGGTVQGAVGQRPPPRRSRRSSWDWHRWTRKASPPSPPLQGDRRRGRSACETHCCAPSMPTSCSPRRRRWPISRGTRTPRSLREANKRYATTESRLTNLKKHRRTVRPSKLGTTSTRRYRSSSTARE